MPSAALHLRLPVAALAAAGVTFGLFLFMHKLISSGGQGRPELEEIAHIRFGKVDIPEELVSKVLRKPPQPPAPRDPPRPPRMQLSRLAPQLQDLPQLDLPELQPPLAGGAGMFIGSFEAPGRQADGDIIPVMVMRPMYPREAAMAGIEGWVKVEFTITEQGDVRDPQVVDAQPPRVFNRAALRAILKWKFKPRVVEGVAVERRATQVIDFALDEPPR
jgi:protein TonB